MTTTLFIADLHLEDVVPDNTARFLQFLREAATGADALYILGDLFEAWVGDDDPSETGRVVADGISALASSGTPVFFMHGNRDFLLGEGYAIRAGMRLLPDPVVIDLYGEDVLLSHGDLFCSEDAAYQQFRATTRSPQWQAQFLAQPLEARLAFAQQAREASKSRYAELQDAGTAETITDVTSAAVQDAFKAHAVHRIIHGHTHRPALHDEGDGKQRCVVGDWYGKGPRYLSATPCSSDSSSIDVRLLAFDAAS